MRPKILLVSLALASGLLLSQKKCDDAKVCPINGKTRTGI